ncbi:hypothetical protein [Sphingomonas sanxanigenens]|uniref:TonB C-terminal domain-containing protein n=1 Tax=Sphingomonas sanxanigenens DSM 19645 = NX02 TaxID=1123269 RepID=W0A478_9SPHN|nr:hypothetical protein [Sphingomonas sanxanigenens]AHE51841.1 hypothetical protein NX02_00365 [Sphingomonas sanxanigenens DSM 19645 = NX02]
MDRADRAGLGVAVVAHVALFALLSLQIAQTSGTLESKPVEIVMSDEFADISSAPDPSREAPATKRGEVEGPAEPTAPPPAEDLPPAPRPEPVPAPAPQPAPAPKPAPQPVKKPAKPDPKPTKPNPKPQAKPARPATAPPRDRSDRRRPDRPVRPTGRLDRIDEGLNTRDTPSTSTRQQAQATGPARQTINAAIGNEIRPYWRPPSGVDVERLVTKIRFELNEDGSLAGEPQILGQTGKTASNAPQMRLHAENAIRAIKRAAPFRLPRENYAQWKTWTFDFDARLTE